LKWFRGEAPDSEGVHVVIVRTRRDAAYLLIAIEVQIRMHIAGLREDGLAIPEPSGEFVDIGAA
jgi:hypothetical protein